MIELQEVYKSLNDEIYFHLSDGMENLRFPIIVVSLSPNSEIIILNIDGLPFSFGPCHHLCCYRSELISMAGSCYRSQIESTPRILPCKQMLFSLKKYNGIGIMEFMDIMLNSDKQLIYEAADILGVTANSADVKHLIQIIMDDNTQVSRVAIWTLGKIGDPSAVPTLIDVIRTHKPKSQELAITSLGKIGDISALPVLVDTLKLDNIDLRYTSLYAISLIKDASVINQVIEVMINDEDKHVRGRAALTLGEIGHPRSVPNLVSALKDDYYGVRDNAASALGMIGDSTAIPALIEVVKTDSEYGVRAVAASALAKIGGSSSVSALNEARNDESVYVRNRVRSLLKED